MRDAQMMQGRPVLRGEGSRFSGAEEDARAEGAGGCVEGEQGWIAQIIDVGDGVEGWGEGRG